MNLHTSDYGFETHNPTILYLTGQTPGCIKINEINSYAGRFMPLTKYGIRLGKCTASYISGEPEQVNELVIVPSHSYVW